MEYQISLSQEELAELDAILREEMVLAGLELPEAHMPRLRSRLEHRAEIIKHLRKEVESARNARQAWR